MGVILIAIIVYIVFSVRRESKYKALEAEVLNRLGISGWNVISYCDAEVTVKSRQALEKYDVVKYFKEHRDELTRAERTIASKTKLAMSLNEFLENNEYKRDSLYRRLVKQNNAVL